MTLDQYPPVLTPKEAAEILRVNIKTVYESIERGQLPAAKFGKQWRISRATIEKLISSSVASTVEKG